MNHIFFAREHLLVVYTETPDHPRPEGLRDTALVDMTNWASDIMDINETKCMVFADPNFMSSMGTGFTSNGELITGALVWRDRYLYRHNLQGELDMIGDFPSPWHNLARGYYQEHHGNGELYDELMETANKADNINETKEYQDHYVARMLRLFVKYDLPVQYGYCINVRNGCMSRINRQRMKEIEELSRNKRKNS